MPPALLGRTPVMTGVYKQIAHAASADAPVLIIGESGTGKELVARAIHQHGNRSDAAVCAHQLRRADRDAARVRAVRTRQGIVHRRGRRRQRRVPDGAHRHGVPRRGRRDVAGAAGEAAARAAGGRGPAGRLEPRRHAPTCASSAATNVDVERAVAEGKFRQDLFYRLGVVIIKLPPLRERREDIPLLVERFLQGGAWPRRASRWS